LNVKKIDIKKKEYIFIFRLKEKNPFEKKPSPFSGFAV